MVAYHEPTEELSAQTRDFHRALSSLMEECEAVDWYQHRIDATHDDSLRRLLQHNRDEELEHASMMLEWLRRRMPRLDATLRTYLFTSGPIEEIEEDATEGESQSGGSAPASSPSLGVGKFSKGSE